MKHLNSNKIDLIIAILLSGLIGASAIVIAIVSKGYEGGADTIGHYILSRYALTKPTLLMDIWGRPIFTLFGIPFALLGFTAMKFYTIITGLLTGWLSFLLVKKLGYAQPWMVIPMVLLAPIYFLLMVSPLTETMMGLMLVAAIWAFFTERYYLSALLISFIPFARFEAFVIFPPFILALIIRRKPYALLLLPIGYLLFSTIGYFVFNNFFWLIDKNPYNAGDIPLYGKGELWHFVEYWPYIQGSTLGILFLIGVVALFVSFILNFKRLKLKSEASLLLILVLGSTLAYYSAHSYAWYSGRGNSLGLLRMMAAVMPAASILSFLGYSTIVNFIKKYSLLKISFPLILFLLLLDSNRIYEYPIPLSQEEVLMTETADWIKENNLDSKKLYYYNIFLGVLLHENPFDESDGSMMIHFNYLNTDQIANNSILVWDSHFSANEGGLSLDNIMNNKSMKLVKVIKPENEFKVLGNLPYQICIFEKTDEKGDISKNNSTFYQQEIDHNNNISFAQFNSFEGLTEAFASPTTTEMSYQGSRSLLITPDKEYTAFIDDSISILGEETEGTLIATVWIKEKEKNDKAVLHLIFDFGNKKQEKYQGISNKYPNKKENGWLCLELKAEISGQLPSEQLKVYLWNPEQNSFNVDNYSLKFIKNPK